MRLYRIAPAAERDIETILARTDEELGDRARLRYEALLIRAITDVAELPERAGSQQRPEIATSARMYHIRHSRDRVKTSIGKVKRPRHFLLYRTLAGGGIEIGRVLHDSLDFSRHVPDEYKAPSENPEAAD